MFKVLLPGTFDPPTNGHLNILRRASRLFDAVEVVIAVNPGKTYLFSAEERLAMMTALAQGLPNVTVSTWNGLIVDFADRIGVHVIVRGVRALADFDYEFELSLMNRSLNPRIETIFLPDRPEVLGDPLLGDQGHRGVRRGHLGDGASQRGKSAAREAAGARTAAPGTHAETPGALTFQGR